VGNFGYYLMRKSSIFRTVDSIKLRWAGHMARIGCHVKRWNFDEETSREMASWKIEEM
jgi:hypothetical protein